MARARSLSLSQGTCSRGRRGRGRDRFHVAPCRITKAFDPSQSAAGCGARYHWSKCQNPKVLAAVLRSGKRRPAVVSNATHRSARVNAAEPLSRLLMTGLKSIYNLSRTRVSTRINPADDLARQQCGVLERGINHGGMTVRAVPGVMQFFATPRTMSETIRMR